MFPALADNDYAYLNSGGSGPPPYFVVQAMRETDDLCSGPAYLEGVGLYARQREANARAREAVSRLIQASPESVALTQNTTHGMNLGTASINWEPGDEVLSTTTEHPGCLVPLHVLRDRYGLKVNLIPPPVTAEKVADAMTPKTRLVSLSHVDWTTGEVLPLAEICAVVREHGALSLVDGAQSVGNIEVDAPATGADMYAFTGHKWLMGPEGMGAFYVRPGCDSYSTNVGYAALAEGATFDHEGNYELASGARRFEASTMSAALAEGFAAAAEAAHERGSAGPEEIRSRADYLMDLLSEVPNLTLRSPRQAQSGLVSFEVEGIVPKDAVGSLLEQKFVVRFIPDPQPYIRVSTHLFNAEEELDALVESIRRL